MRYRVFLNFFLAGGMLAASAEEASAPSDKKVPPAEKKEETAKEEPKEAKPKETSGTVTIGGIALKYLAQTGTLPVLKEDGGTRANVFYVYYATAGDDGKRAAEKSAGRRPITFCFNGGPGAAAVWLHLGGLGPRRIDWPADGLAPNTVRPVVENPNSILDRTDLVFIDPVGTGVSRAAKGEKAEQFFGVDEDIEAVSEFIRLFTTREQRWASPKYLCGESYGVLRAAGVADYLQDHHGMYLEGVMLLSGLLNWQTLSADPGNDLPFIVGLPVLTATAHYHKKLASDLQSDFRMALAEARSFARNEYALALLKGRTIASEERASIASKLARLTGLSAQQIDEQELRIRPEFFREMLLRSEGRIVGRFDGRVTSEDGGRQRLAPEFDPSLSHVIGAFAASINAYIRSELGYESDHPYRVLTGLPWKYTTYANKYLAMEPRLADAMKQNPKMRVLVLTGHRDLAVPPDAIRYSIEHLPIPNSLRANIQWAEYESGHMMYLYARDAEKLRGDLAGFIKEPAP